jgi:hypothetical protein
MMGWEHNNLTGDYAWTGTSSAIPNAMHEQRLNQLPPSRCRRLSP